MSFSVCARNERIIVQDMKKQELQRLYAAVRGNVRSIHKKEETV